VTDLDT